MKKILSLVFVLATLVSCSRKTAPVSQVSVTDSFNIETWEEKQDTTFIVPGASIAVKVPLKDVYEGFKGLSDKVGNATVSLSVKTDTKGVQYVQANCKCDTAAIEAVLRHKFQATSKSTVKTEKIIVPEKYIPWAVRVLAWIGGIYLAITAILFVSKIKK